LHREEANELSVLQMAGDCLFFPRFVRFVFVRNYCRAVSRYPWLAGGCRVRRKRMFYGGKTEDTRRRDDEQPQQLRSYTWTCSTG
jgi:hypothetical protein